MAGFLAAAGLIGGAASAAGHGLADSHKRAGDVGGADVIFQTATTDGRSYVDQSKNEYHISLTGGTAPGTQLDRQLQDALEKYERDKRARARASMMHDG